MIQTKAMVMAVAEQILLRVRQRSSSRRSRNQQEKDPGGLGSHDLQPNRPPKPSHR